CKSPSDDPTLSTLTLRRVDHGFCLPHRPIIGDEGNWTHGTIVENRSRQGATEHSTGVQVKSIGPILRLAGFNRGVAMDNIATMVARVRQERLTNPQQVILVLLIERDARANAGMHKEPLVVTLGQRQAVEPNKVL